MKMLDTSSILAGVYWLPTSTSTDVSVVSLGCFPHPKPKELEK